MRKSFNLNTVIAGGHLTIYLAGGTTPHVLQDVGRLWFAMSVFEVTVARVLVDCTKTDA